MSIFNTPFNQFKKWLSKAQAAVAVGVPAINENGDLVDQDGNLVFGVVIVTESRDLTQSDNGQTLDCTEPDLTITVTDDLVNFGCAIINNTTTIAFSGDATGNGAADDIELTAAVGAIVPTSTSNAYKVVG